MHACHCVLCVCVSVSVCLYLFLFFLFLCLSLCLSVCVLVCLLLSMHAATGGAARLVEVQELVMVDEAASFRSPGSVELVERPMGINTVGVVAWLLLLRSPEYPQGRPVRNQGSSVYICRNSELHGSIRCHIMACLLVLLICCAAVRLFFYCGFLSYC